MRIVDAHCHLAPEELSDDALVAAMDRDGIERAVVMAKTMPYCPPIPQGKFKAIPYVLRGPLAPWGRRSYENNLREGRIRVGSQWVEVLREPDNEEVAAAVRRHPTRLAGLVFLNPASGGDPMTVLRHYVEQEGFVGVKLHAWWHNVDLALELTEVAEYCQSRGLPILVHLGSRPQTSNVEGLLRSFPNLVVILAHGGIPHFDRFWPLIRKFDTLFTDLSGDYVKPKLTRQIVRKVGVSKAIWGTDAPYTLRQSASKEHYDHSFRQEIEKAMALPISDSEKERIFSGNILRILRLDDKYAGSSGGDQGAQGAREG